MLLASNFRSMPAHSCILRGNTATKAVLTTAAGVSASLPGSTGAGSVSCIVLRHRPPASLVAGAGVGNRVGTGVAGPERGREPGPDRGQERDPELGRERGREPGQERGREPGALAALSGRVGVGGVVGGGRGAGCTGRGCCGAGFDRCTTTVVTWGACGAGGRETGAGAAGGGGEDVTVTAASTGVVVSLPNAVKPNTAAVTTAAAADSPNKMIGARRGDGGDSCHSSCWKCQFGARVGGLLDVNLGPIDPRVFGPRQRTDGGRRLARRRRPTPQRRCRGQASSWSLPRRRDCGGRSASRRRPRSARVRCGDNGCAQVLGEALGDQRDARTAADGGDRRNGCQRNAVARQRIVKGGKEIRERCMDEVLELAACHADLGAVSRQVGDDGGRGLRRQPLLGARGTRRAAGQAIRPSRCPTDRPAEPRRGRP